MFGGGGSNSPAQKIDNDHREESNSSPSPSPDLGGPTNINASGQAASGEKRGGNGSPTGRDELVGANEKKRRSSGVSSKASSLLASARNSFGFAQTGRGGTESSTQSPLHKFGKQDSTLAVPQGPRNNSAGESVPGPKSTFRVGVWEDRNKRCRRTMEDTHAFLYNFLETPAPSNDAQEKHAPARNEAVTGRQDKDKRETVQSDNGYFAIFDGHAGTFAADWCGKKVHLILEDIIRNNPNAAIPELLDQTFTTVDAQLEKLPLKNSGCTAAIAMLRWEDRVSSERSVTGSMPIAPAAAASSAAASVARCKEATLPNKGADAEKDGLATGGGATDAPTTSEEHARLKGRARRQRVLYTANVGDARIILCRAGKALRLSYDHKGSDENEGRRITNAGGLIVNNRVNGVLAVTRALGDVYIKELVTGHPYTTETVIQADLDEFLIIACDGLWDVCSDQEAVDLVRPISDPDAASKLLVDHALGRFSTDNLSCMIIRFCRGAATQGDGGRDRTSSVDGATSKVSEAEEIVLSTRLQLAEENAADSERPATSKNGGYDKKSSLRQSEKISVPTLDDDKFGEAPTTLAHADGRQTRSERETCEVTREGGPEAARAQPGME